MAHAYYTDGTIYMTANAYYRDIATNEDTLATVAMCTVEVYRAETLVETFEGTDDPATIAYDQYEHRFACAYTPTVAGDYTFKFLITASDNPVRRGVDWGEFTVQDEI